MKKLYLLRHAKSDWKTPANGDFERPLAPRGQKAAPRVGQEISRLKIKPGLVLCSTARRAAQTYELIAENLPKKHIVEHRLDLYMASPAKLLKIIRQQSDDFESILMIGHNPGTEALASHIAGPESPRRLIADLNEKYPTAALAAFDLDISAWRDLSPGDGTLTHFIKPRDLVCEETH